MTFVISLQIINADGSVDYGTTREDTVTSAAAVGISIAHMIADAKPGDAFDVTIQAI